MGDSKKPSIPAWQKQSSLSTDKSGLDSKPDQETQTQPYLTNRKDLLEQAKAFLAHEEIRDGTTESKISFLEEKGLTNDEIHELLGISRNDTAAPEPAADVRDHVESDAEQQAAVSSSAEPASNPPIITYPEFLIHASKPAPLITPVRAVNMVYLASLVGAGVYGASKFVLQPMFDTLSEARHEFFSTTKEQLDPLNERLEKVVSTIPPRARASNVGHERREEEGEEDGSSIASDPTEMFHRDMGVQTEIPLSPNSLSSADEGEKGTPTAIASLKLQALKEHLDGLLESSEAELKAAEKAKAELKDTEVYLDHLRFGQGGNGYGALSGDDGWRNQIFGAKVAGSSAAKKGDAFEEFKQDIRSMKGKLLSARNFPRSAR